MTFVEFILFILALVTLYLLLRPLQRYLEPRLIHLFRNKARGAKKTTIIDITNYTKKE